MSRKVNTSDTGSLLVHLETPAYRLPFSIQPIDGVIFCIQISGSQNLCVFWAGFGIHIWYSFGDHMIVIFLTPEDWSSILVANVMRLHSNEPCGFVTFLLLVKIFKMWKKRSVFQTNIPISLMSMCVWEAWLLPLRHFNFNSSSLPGLSLRVDVKDTYGLLAYSKLAKVACLEI